MLLTGDTMNLFSTDFNDSVVCPHCKIVQQYDWGKEKDKIKPVQRCREKDCDKLFKVKCKRILIFKTEQ